MSVKKIKSKSLIFLAFVSALMLTNCAKAVIDDINQRAECVALLGDFTTNGGNKACAQQATDIDIILRDCGEFLMQDQKDELNLAKENCSDD